MSGKKVPRFYGFRIYTFSTLLYYSLVLPFILILTIKYAPGLREKNNETNRTEKQVADQLKLKLDSVARLSDFSGDSLNKILKDGGIDFSDTLNEINLLINPSNGITVENNGVAIENNNRQIGKVFNVMLNLLLISFFLGFLFNLPFKILFIRARKGKEISPWIHNFCKKYLLKSSLINALILFFAFISTNGYMFYTMQFSTDPFANELEESIYLHFYYISFFASVLASLFVYYWQKHRVHMRYIEHVYSEEELRQRIFKFRVGRIRYRMFVSSAMTTLLPLTIVIIYLFLSVTRVGDLKINDMSEDQMKILFGDYSLYKDMFITSDEDFSIPGWLFYINALNSFFMFIGIYSSIFVVFIYILFIVKWTTNDIVYPVKELLENIKSTGKGKLYKYSLVRTNDEIGELTEGYNEMTQKLGNYFTDISKMTEAYSYFVPRQFLDFLGKKSYVDIKLGDQVQKEMTVMFSDIRSFTEISEQMTPKENFDYLNYYLGYMEPVIRNNNGFIDKYIGDSIMALFGEKAEDAINSAIEMRIKLSQFNQVMDQFNKPTINSGIGIHSGSLMLGVVGGEGRMDGTVISDAVNLASRLEGLTKVYGSSIIISQDTLIKLENASIYNYRFLDIVKVKGKKEAVYIFEIIDGDPEDIKHQKLITKDNFAEGINLYKSGRFEEALMLFADVFAINQHDKTSQLYLNRCRKLIKYGVPEHWDGIETIDWS